VRSFRLGDQVKKPTNTTQAFDKLMVHDVVGA
jgi:hypothetical protein